MFFNKRRMEKERQLIEVERERLSTLTERELLIEVVLKLNEISMKCDGLARKIAIYSD